MAKYLLVVRKEAEEDPTILRYPEGYDLITLHLDAARIASSDGVLSVEVLRRERVVARDFNAVVG